MLMEVRLCLVRRKTERPMDRGDRLDRSPTLVKIFELPIEVRFHGGDGSRRVQASCRNACARDALNRAAATLRAGVPLADNVWTMHKAVLLIFAVLPLVGCGDSHVTTTAATRQPRPSNLTVAEVRKAFSHHGIHLHEPFAGLVPPGQRFLSAMVLGSATASGGPPYAPQRVPITIDVDVYSSAHAAQAGSQWHLTIGGSNMPTRTYRVRNVVIRFHGYGTAPRAAAVLRELG